MFKEGLLGVWKEEMRKVTVFWWLVNGAMKFF